MKDSHSGCCAGHRCDECDLCLSGTCCGADVAETNLPRQGSWPNEWHGELGVLKESNGKVECHICGKWFIELGRHVSAKHKVSADEYRAYFGLATKRALCPKSFSKERSERAKEQGLGKHTTTPKMTSEQYSLIAYKREARLETATKRKEQLAKISKMGNDARWAQQRQQKENARIHLKRHPIE